MKVLIDTVKLIMEKLYSLFGILTVSGAECVDALASPVSDYEDAVMERVSAKTYIDYIIRRNVKDYQLGTVKAISPDAFIVLMKDK